MHTPDIPRPILLAMIFALTSIEFLQSGMIAYDAAPTMGRIGATPEQWSLISAAYAAAAVLAISQMTVLVQRLGWRDYVAATVLLFLGGAWTSATSTTVAGFLAGRLLMGLGGGVFFTLGRMLIHLIPPSPARMGGIAALGAGIAAALALAPWVASALAGAEASPALFLVLALPATAAGVLALRWLPSGAAPLDSTPSRFDLGDGVLLACAAFLLLYPLQRLSYDWHGERMQLMVPLLAGLALSGLFLHNHGRRAHPFLRLDMLRSGRYLTGMLIFGLAYALLGMFNTLMPQLVQRTLGIGLEQAGMLQSAGMALSAPTFIVILLVARKRPHATKFYVTGFLLLAAFGWHFSRLDPAAPAWRSVAPWIGLFGGFVSLAMATTALHSFKDVQHDNVLMAHAQQLKNMLGQVWSVLGAGIAAILLQQRSALHAERLAEHAAAAAPVLAGQVSLLASLDVFRALAWIGVAGALALAFQKRFD
jgi:MFS family permease